MRTYIYVDGFNLFYRALKGTPAKWLDPMALFRRVLQPHHRILRIRCFTARVRALDDDPGKPQRQDVYLHRAGPLSVRNPEPITSVRSRPG